MDTDRVQWCNLPKDMLIIVAKHLDSRIEILRLRAVCSSWRSSLPHSLSKSPLFSVRFPFPIAPGLLRNLSGYYTLTERMIYYLEPCSFENRNASASPKGWMVKVEEDKYGKMSMSDTLSKRHWPTDSILSPEVLNLLSFRVSEASTVYDFLCPILFDHGMDNVITPVEWKYIEVKKVAMSSIPAWIDDNNGDHAILALHNGGSLWYFKLGDKKWTMIDDGQQESYGYIIDISYHNGNFYAIDNNGKTIVIDPSLNVRVIESPVHPAGDLVNDKYKFLVESNGNLYLVVMYFHLEIFFSTSNCSSIYLEVFKLNEEDKNWVLVRSLGDQTFFIGDTFCFSVSAKQFSGCKRNCIYFRNRFFCRERDDHPGYDVCVFDLESLTCVLLSSFKGYFQIFWPLPTWLMLEISSEPSSSSC